VIRPGDVQRMSAGRGVMHSEFNHSKDSQAHFLQIWIEPNLFGIQPGYEQKRFEPEEKRGRLRLIASPDGSDGSVTIHQDARVYAGLFDGEDSAGFGIVSGRRVYVHVVKGEISINGTPLRRGDALKTIDEDRIDLLSGRQAEVLVFDLP
jgi:redox-sensitive bicupin YhaK (pirin superfamily)